MKFYLLLLGFGLNSFGQVSPLSGSWVGFGVADQGHKASYYCRFQFTLSLEPSSFTINQMNYFCDHGTGGFGQSGAKIKYKIVQNTLYKDDKPVGTITEDSIWVYPSSPNKFLYFKFTYKRNRIIYSSQWGTHYYPGNLRGMLKKIGREKEDR